jgi:hypothetical protein
MVGKTAAKVAMIVLVALLVAYFAADFIVRSPALWWLTPRWLLNLTVFVLNPTTQEEVADVEFLTALLSVVTIFAAATVIVLLWRRNGARSL